MWRQSDSSRGSAISIWLLLHLLLEITNHSTSAMNTPSDGYCSSSQTCEGPDCNASGSCQETTAAATSLEEENSCLFDAENGLCISDPEEMFRKCSPDDHCLNREDFGAFVVVSPIYNSGSPGSCQDDPTEFCEDFACVEQACLLNPGFMHTSCPKSCYICFENENDNGSNISLVKIPIGLKQTLPLTATETEKKTFYEVITETASYMTQAVFAKEDYKDARRDCRNYDDSCAWMVASDRAFCDEHKNKKLCGPACKACGDMILTFDELEILDDCIPDYSKDIFENDRPETDKSNDIDDSQTIDAMFRRIVGELRYTSLAEEPYPIVPGVNYTVKVLSRPSLNPDIHKNISWNSIDFHIGGPWIVVLDDFLSSEECDRLIELGDLAGRQKSTIQDDDDTYEGDQNDEEEPEWRTSSTAWCSDSCRLDPVAQRVRERIGFTTGVTDDWYFEDLQLLKYNPGEYYMEHHDEVGDVHDSRYLRRGQRLLTFFLYLNDVEEGGETRFTDLMGDDSGIYLDVVPKKGRALLWPSMTNEDLYAMDDRTYHEARAVKKGVKYGANAWMHIRDYSNPAYDSCDDEAVVELREKWDFSSITEAKEKSGISWC